VSHRHPEHGSSFFSFLFCWDRGLNSGLHACKAGALLLQPHLQSILLYGCFEDAGSRESSKLFAWTGLEL
jgi:hypothetical protein